MSISEIKNPWVINYRGDIRNSNYYVMKIIIIGAKVVKKPKLTKFGGENKKSPG